MIVHAYQKIDNPDWFYEGTVCHVKAKFLARMQLNDKKVVSKRWDKVTCKSCLNKRGKEK